MSTICSINTAENYRGVVRAVTQIDPSPRDELLEAAVHAANAVAKYVRKGFLRRQFKANGVETIVVATAKGPVILPSVETFLLFTHIEIAVQFLSSITGVGVVANKFPEDECPF